MRRQLRLLAGYVYRYLLEWLASWSFILTLTVNGAITPLIGLAVWTVALRGQYHITAYYLALLAVQMATLSWENHTFSQRIYNGELADLLLCPHPAVLQPFGMNIAMRLWHIVFGLPLLLAMAALTGSGFDIGLLPLALPALLAAAALRFLFTYLLSLSAFWTEQAHGAVGLGSTLVFLLGGEAAPIAVLPGPLRPWGEALPFHAMLGFPAEIASGTLNSIQIVQGYLWQSLWLGLFALVACAVWNRGLRRFTAVGG